MPVLPSEILSAVLCALVAAFYVRTGVAAIALMLLVLLTFQYLLRELLLSRERAERLAALQLGVLVSMIETLALRDRMTARHSAAVARYARAMAQALGWPREPSRSSSTPPALLHDIGKFAFPDSILLADSRLTHEQWEAVKRHPEDGARIVQRLDGYGPVAEIVHAHHERWDGNGYPRGLAGEEIPPARAADRRRRHLRRDHRARLLPQAALDRGGDRRSCARSPAASSTRRSSRSSSSC